MLGILVVVWEGRPYRDHVITLQCSTHGVVSQLTWLVSVSLVAPQLADFRVERGSIEPLKSYRSA